MICAGAPLRLPVPEALQTPFGIDEGLGRDVGFQPPVQRGPLFPMLAFSGLLQLSQFCSHQLPFPFEPGGQFGRWRRGAGKINIGNGVGPRESIRHQLPLAFRIYPGTLIGSPLQADQDYRLAVVAREIAQDIAHGDDRNFAIGRLRENDRGEAGGGQDSDQAHEELRPAFHVLYRTLRIRPCGAGFQPAGPRVVSAFPESVDTNVGAARWKACATP
jgi:hypothetical protein